MAINDWVLIQIRVLILIPIKIISGNSTLYFSFIAGMMCSIFQLVLVLSSSDSPDIINESSQVILLVDLHIKCTLFFVINKCDNNNFINENRSNCRNLDNMLISMCRF